MKSILHDKFKFLNLFLNEDKNYLLFIQFVTLLILLSIISNVPAKAASYTDEDVSKLIQEMTKLRQHSLQLEKQLKKTQETLSNLVQKQAETEKQAPSKNYNKTDMPTDSKSEVSIKPFSIKRNVKKTDATSAETKKIKSLKIGGKISLGHRYRTPHDSNKNHQERGGDTSLGNLRVDFDANYDNVILDAQYRFYPWGDLLHHAYVGYDITDNWQIQAGVMKVPFGILPYASNDGWYGLSYYMGYEDDYDFGLKFKGQIDDWKIQAAFFKNDEYSNPSRTTRYSIDVLSDSNIQQYNRETNQFNLQLARLFKHGNKNKTELGLSLEWGQLYNDNLGDSGYHDGIAAHLKGKYGPWGVMTEIIRYRNKPKTPKGVSDKLILLGGYGGSYLAAAKGILYDLNLAYEYPMVWGPITKATLFTDYSYLDKDESTFYDSQIVSAGINFSLGPAALSFEYTVGKNAMWLGRELEPMGAGSADARWNGVFSTQLNYWF